MYCGCRWAGVTDIVYVYTTHKFDTFCTIFNLCQRTGFFHSAEDYDSHVADSPTE